MYRHCIFCASALGTNQLIEHFPIGARLAFDEQKGRLWVVCPVCERWNLSPLDERWEALEECERSFRQTRLRVHTENIGMARLVDGTELIRIGTPLRPELAAWRYGDQFGRRRRSFVVKSAVVLGAGSGIVIGSGMLLGISVGFFPMLQLWSLYSHLRITPIRIPVGEQRTLVVSPVQLHQQKLRPRPNSGWQLEVTHREGTDILTGAEAQQALMLLMPSANPAGASKAEVAAAVREIEEVGTPDRYLAAAELRARRQGWGYRALPGMPRTIRLAVELAVNEEQERAAVEGELVLLERAWRESEEIAAIADSLGMSEKVELMLGQLKQRARTARRSESLKAVEKAGQVVTNRSLTSG